MKRIALLHTARGMIEQFEAELRAAVGPEPALHHMMDDFLLTDLLEHGRMTGENLTRLYGGLRTLQLTGADAIVVTSPLLIREVGQFRPLIRVPIAVLGEAAARRAAAGNRVTILSGTLETGEALRRQIARFPRKRGGRPPEVEVLLCARAQEAFRRNPEAAGRLLRETALEIKNRDMVLLAQPWMSRFAGEVRGICGGEMLSASGLCIEQLAEGLQKDEKKAKIDPEGVVHPEKVTA